MSNIWRMLRIGLVFLGVGIVLGARTDLDILAAMYIIGGTGLALSAAIMIRNTPPA